MGCVFVVWAFHFIVLLHRLIHNFNTPPQSNPSHEFKNRPLFEQVFTRLMHVTAFSSDVNMHSQPCLPALMECVVSVVNLLYRPVMVKSHSAELMHLVCSHIDTDRLSLTSCISHAPPILNSHFQPYLLIVHDKFENICWKCINSSIVEDDMQILAT